MRAISVLASFIAVSLCGQPSFGQSDSALSNLSFREFLLIDDAELQSVLDACGGADCAAAVKATLDAAKSRGVQGEYLDFDIIRPLAVILSDRLLEDPSQAEGVAAALNVLADSAYSEDNATYLKEGAAAFKDAKNIDELAIARALLFVNIEPPAGRRRMSGAGGG